MFSKPPAAPRIDPGPPARGGRGPRLGAELRAWGGPSSGVRAESEPAPPGPSSGALSHSRQPRARAGSVRGIRDGRGSYHHRECSRLQGPRRPWRPVPDKPCPRPSTWPCPGRPPAWGIARRMCSTVRRSARAALGGFPGRRGHSTPGRACCHRRSVREGEGTGQGWAALSAPPHLSLLICEMGDVCRGLLLHGSCCDCSHPGSTESSCCSSGARPGTSHGAYGYVKQAGTAPSPMPSTPGCTWLARTNALWARTGLLPFTPGLGGTHRDQARGGFGAGASRPRERAKAPRPQPGPRWALGAARAPDPLQGCERAAPPAARLRLSGPGAEEGDRAIYRRAIDWRFASLLRQPVDASIKKLRPNQYALSAGAEVKGISGRPSPLQSHRGPRDTRRPLAWGRVAAPLPLVGPLRLALPLPGPEPVRVPAGQLCPARSVTSLVPRSQAHRGD